MLQTNMERESLNIDFDEDLLALMIFYRRLFRMSSSQFAELLT